MKSRIGNLLAALLVSASMPVAAETVDWSFITVDDACVPFTTYLKTWAEIRDAMAKFGSPDMRADAPSAVLDKVINNEILALEARKKEIDVSEQEIDERLEMFKKMNNLDDETFRQVLKQQDVKLEDLRKNYREQIRNEKLQQMEIRSRVKPPADEDLRKFYDENRDRMIYPERRRVLHILFVPNPEATLSDQMKLKKNLETAYKLASSGSDFASLAKQYSMDEVSRTNGGDLGWIEQGTMSPEFEAAIFKLKKGQVSQVFQSRAGWHIAKVTDVKSSSAMSFEDAKANIRNMLIQKGLEEAFLQWVRDKRDTYGIRVTLSDGRSFVLTRGAWIDESSRKNYDPKEFVAILDTEFKKAGKQ